MAANTKAINRFAKFLSYVLGYRPDEFGLLPDDNGWLPFKELLKALNEEKGWRHIRIAHLKEISYAIAPSPIEFHEGMVRARDRTRLPKIEPGIVLPKLLYLAVRRRAYPVILEKGLPYHSDRPRLVLSADEAMAQRIGRRRDQQPVLITLHVASCADQGTYFQKYGEGLFLADAIYPGTFHGPPLPRIETTPSKPDKEAEPAIPKTPGSYYPDLSPEAVSKPRRNKAEWKKDRRAARRHKARQQKQ
jgi:putative RNA 2'-phosphotransferase